MGCTVSNLGNTNKNNFTIDCFFQLHLVTMIINLCQHTWNLHLQYHEAWPKLCRLHFSCPMDRKRHFHRPIRFSDVLFCSLLWKAMVSVHFSNFLRLIHLKKLKNYRNLLYCIIDKIRYLILRYAFKNSSISHTQPFSLTGHKFRFLLLSEPQHTYIIM